MYKIIKLKSASTIISLLSVIFFTTACSLLDESLTTNSSNDESAVLTVEERQQQVVALLTQAENLMTNAANLQDLQLGEAKLNQAQAHLEYLPTSYTSVSVESSSSSRRRSRSSRRSSRRVRKDYDVDVDTIYDDKYAGLRTKAEELRVQLLEKQQLLAQNVSQIQLAKQIAFAAAKASQKPPHRVEVWEYIEKLWYKAINELESIDENQPGYVEAQKLLKAYQNNLKIIQSRMQIEADAVEKLYSIYDRVESLTKSPPSDRQVYIWELQDIVKQLKNIKPGTTAYVDAQKLLASAQKILKS
jgi:uncharacterized protein YoxC